jgi:hypothetical protein
VVSHQTPGINRPGIEFLDLLDDIDEMERFGPVVEYKLSSGDSAIDVEGGSGKKQTAFSRHRKSSMRGQDAQSLIGPAHDSTIRNVLPI